MRGYVVDRFENSLDTMKRMKRRKDQSQHEKFFQTSRQELVACERNIGIRGPR